MKKSSPILWSALTGCGGALGLWCLWYWLFVVGWDGKSHHPYGYPFSVCAGLLSLVFVMMTAALWFRQVRCTEQGRGKQIALSIGLLLAAFVGSLYLWGYLWEWVGGLLPSVEVWFSEI